MAATPPEDGYTTMIAMRIITNDKFVNTCIEKLRNMRIVLKIDKAFMREYKGAELDAFHERKKAFDEEYRAVLDHMTSSELKESTDSQVEAVDRVLHLLMKLPVIWIHLFNFRYAKLDVPVVNEVIKRAKKYVRIKSPFELKENDKQVICLQNCDIRSSEVICVHTGSKRDRGFEYRTIFIMTASGSVYECDSNGSTDESEPLFAKLPVVHS